MGKKKANKQQRVQEATTEAPMVGVCNQSGPAAISDELWTELDASLFGLLTVHIDDNFIDMKHLCPREVQLHVRLDLVRGEANVKVEKRLVKVLDALGLLCLLAKRTLTDRATASAFWTRLVVSDMMMVPWEEHNDCVKIEMVTTFTMTNGLVLLLCWQYRNLQTYAVRGIGAFLRAPAATYEKLLGGKTTSFESQRVHVGLRFVECHPSTSDLKLLMQLLTVPKSPHDQFLCEANAVRTLEFKSDPFRSSQLDILSSSLASPDMRRVDGLSLEDMIPETSSREYVSSLERVFVAALQSKDYASTGLRLSLGYNQHVQSAHFEALHQALQVATRPLSALSVAGIPGTNFRAWLRLGKIIFTPSQLPTSESCDLDLSGITDEWRACEILPVSLQNLVVDLLPRITAALDGDVPIYCRVERSFQGLPHDRTLQITRIRTTDEAARGELWVVDLMAPGSSMWVSSSTITFLRIGDVDVIGSRFTRLVLATATPQQMHGSHRLTRLLGHGLQQLTLRNRLLLPVQVMDVVKTCPHVEALDLQGSTIYDRDIVMPWGFIEASRLRTINLNGCFANSAIVVNLLMQLLNSRNSSVRLLGLRVDRSLDLAIVEAMLKLLQSNSTLVHVEMPVMNLSEDSETIVALRKAIQAVDCYLQGEHLSQDIKLAFLGVVKHAAGVHLDQDTVRNVFAFTGSNVRRSICWSEQKRW